MPYIIALDQGTTSSRTLIFNEKAQVVASAQQEFKQIFPKSSWVEHNPKEIWESQWQTLQDAIKKAMIQPSEILGIGITNQRETTLLWNRQTGEPVGNAIVWQDRRTASICEEIKADEALASYIRDNTGLVIDAYFSASKIMWMLRNNEKAKSLANEGNLCFGTVDSWLVWKLTEGKVHATDYSNASRTMLYNIKSLSWDQKILDALDIPKSILPEVNPNMHQFGEATFQSLSIPILGIAGDQQAALFGQTCFEKGMAKNTYGTGCFMLMNTGEEFVQSQHGLITTIAFSIDGRVNYALEGSVFIAGAAIQWLRDGLKIIHEAGETEKLAKSVTEDELVLVPAFAGLGAPYWNMNARGAIFGLTRDSGPAQLAKATLQAIAFQTKDLLDAMEKDAGIELKSLQVDGGACQNNYLMQFQADMLDATVERPQLIESTALGAAFLAGIQSGLWNIEDIANFRSTDRSFTPNMEEPNRKKLYDKWQKAVEMTIGWGK